MTLSREEILARKNEIAARHGDWTNHNIHIGHGIRTFPKVGWPDPRVVQVAQIVASLARSPMPDLRICDLGCLEGVFAIELGLRGAQVLGIEGRERNIVKAAFARDVLGLSNVRFVQDDVLNLSRQRYGEFDFVIAPGVFYHLDAPDLLRFLRAVDEVCTTAAVIETHFALKSTESFEAEGVRYHGRRYREHPEGASMQRMYEGNVWTSMSNECSFLLTRPSLINMMANAGFPLVFECAVPFAPMTKDRATFVGVKGDRQHVRSYADEETPAGVPYPEADADERPVAFADTPCDDAGRS